MNNTGDIMQLTCSCLSLKTKLSSSKAFDSNSGSLKIIIFNILEKFEYLKEKSKIIEDIIKNIYFTILLNYFQFEN